MMRYTKSSVLKTVITSNPPRKWNGIVDKYLWLTLSLMSRDRQDRADAALSAEGKRSGPGRRWRFRRAGDGSQRGNAALPLPKRMGQNRAMSLDRSTEAARTSVLKAQTTGDTSERLSEYRMISTYGTSTA
eukprot:m.1144407 g.1144407  ORF g.1144407 m.1144407 type:complete len:131 (+) comp24462_c0_seq25:2589-2981(+)